MLPRYWCALLACLIGPVLPWGAQPASADVVCNDTPEGRVCTVRQPIVNGALVPVATQQQLGLVTVGGGCSGTLVKRYWVLTADHCVTANGRINGPTALMANLTISAAWTSRTAKPTRVVRNWGASGLDIALIFLGAGDLGPANIQLLTVDEPDVGAVMAKYGRGIFAFATPAQTATATAPAVPARPAAQDGQYRTATFTVQSIVSQQTYTLPVNSASQVGDGGDSGGPDILLAPGGVGVGIVGVQSTCVATGTVPPQPLILPNGAVNWPWVTGISSCNSAPVGTVAFDISQITPEKPPADLTAVYYVQSSP